MKLLNIDDLVKPNRAIVIGGHQHQIAEQSVGQLIESAKLAKLQSENGDGVEQFEQFVRTVSRLIPTCPETTIRGLTVKQMIAIVDFANEPDEAVIAEAVAEKKEEVAVATQQAEPAAL